MALAQNEAAMHSFENLNEAEKRDVLRQAHNVRSKAEMRGLISGLSAGKDRK